MARITSSAHRTFAWSLLSAALFLIPVQVFAAGTSKRPIIELLESGTWGWSQGNNTCDSNPHRLKFSIDLSKMYLQRERASADSFNKKTLQNFTYLVDDIGESSVRMRLVGETRKTAAGELVAWILTVQSPTKYCWRRADWADDMCTKAILKCTRK